MIILDDKLSKLPVLPQKVFELLLLKDDKNYDTKKLLEIIENDAVLTAKLLKLANSHFFGFYDKVETPQRALSLYGMNFTVSVLVCELINNSIKFNLDAYDVTFEKYQKILESTFKLLYDWIPEEEASLKEDLIIPIFTSNLGKILFNEALFKENRTEEFLNELFSSININEVEKRFFNYNSYEMSAIILHKWGFDKELIKLVARKNDLDENTKRRIDLLKILDTVSNIKDPFSEKNISKAIEKVKLLDLDYIKFEQVCRRLANYY